MRRAGGHGYCVRFHRLRLLGIPPDRRDFRAPVLAAVPDAAVLRAEHHRCPGVPDVCGGGAVFRVRGPAQGCVCQCVDLRIGSRGALHFQVFRGMVDGGNEAAADFRDVRPGGDADAGDADDREDAL